MPPTDDDFRGDESPCEDGPGDCSGGNEGGTSNEESDCGVSEPVAPHAAKGPERLPADFSGRCPIFPLPGCVFFPHTLLPLHIFEPRYRAMTRAALGEYGDGERLIAMARLREGFDTELTHG
ncbi:MAG: LON peptidase substrate-binding domain-containing protein, partial [Planctomycetota bacterium]